MLMHVTPIYQSRWRYEMDMRYASNSAKQFETAVFVAFCGPFNNLVVLLVTSTHVKGGCIYILCQQKHGWYISLHLFIHPTLYIYIYIYIIIYNYVYIYYMYVCG